MMNYESALKEMMLELLFGVVPMKQRQLSEENVQQMSTVTNDMELQVR